MSKPINALEDFDEDELDKTAQGKGKKILGMEKRYRARFNHVKQAKESQSNGNLLAAVKKYHEYLKVLGDLHECDPYKLKASYFDKEKDLPEMFLISQVYWELSKVYDLTPKLQPQFTDCLSQFILFTHNLPYQVVNAEILRRFIKKGKLNNIKAYQDAYSVIYIANKACYIATECYGIDHDKTNVFRQFRDQISKYQLGQIFIKYYYHYSPRLIYYFRSNPIIGRYLKKYFIIPCLNLFSLLLDKFIIKQ